MEKVKKGDKELKKFEKVFINDFFDKIPIGMDFGMDGVYQELIRKLTYDNNAIQRKAYFMFYHSGMAHRTFKKHGLIEVASLSNDTYRLREKGIEAKARGSYDGYMEDLKRAKNLPVWAFRLSLLSVLISSLAFLVPNIRACMPVKPTHIIVDSVTRKINSIPEQNKPVQGIKKELKKPNDTSNKQMFQKNVQIVSYTLPKAYRILSFLQRLKFHQEVKSASLIISSPIP